MYMYSLQAQDQPWLHIWEGRGVGSVGSSYRSLNNKDMGSLPMCYHPAGTPGEPAAGGGRTPLAPLDGPSGSSGRKQTPGLLQEGSFHLSLDESDNSVLTASRDVSVASECALGKCERCSGLFNF